MKYTDDMVRQMYEALRDFSNNVSEEEELDHMAAGCDETVCILCQARAALERIDDYND
jgi:hypothetical protein